MRAIVNRDPESAVEHYTEDLLNLRDRIFGRVKIGDHVAGLKRDCLVKTVELNAFKIAQADLAHRKALKACWIEYGDVAASKTKRSQIECKHSSNGITEDDIILSEKQLVRKPALWRTS